MANYSDYGTLRTAISTGEVAIGKDGYIFPTLMNKPEVIQSEHLYRAALDVIKEASKEFKTSHGPECMEKLVRAYNVLHLVERKEAKGVFAFFKNLKESYELNSALKTTENIFTQNFDKFVTARTNTLEKNVTLETSLNQHVTKVETAIKEFDIPHKDWNDLKLALAQERKTEAKQIWNSILAQVRVQTGTHFKNTKQVEDFLFDKLPIQNIMTKPGNSQEAALIHIVKGYSNDKKHIDVQQHLSCLLLRGDAKELDRYLKAHKNLPEIGNLLRSNIVQNPGEISDHSNIRAAKILPEEGIARQILGRGKVLHAVQEYFIQVPAEFDKVRWRFPLEQEEKVFDKEDPAKEIDTAATISLRVAKKTKSDIDVFFQDLSPQEKSKALEEVQNMNEAELHRLYYVTMALTFEDLKEISPDKPLEVLRNETLFNNRVPEGKDFNPTLHWLSDAQNEHIIGIGVLEKLTKAMAGSSSTDHPTTYNKEVSEEDNDFEDFHISKEAPSPTNNQKLSSIDKARQELAKQIVTNNAENLHKLPLRADQMRMLGTDYIKATKPENIKELKLNDLSSLQRGALTPEQAKHLTKEQWNFLVTNVPKEIRPQVMAHYPGLKDLLPEKLIVLEPALLLAFLRQNDVTSDKAEKMLQFLPEIRVHPSDAQKYEEIKKHIILSLPSQSGSRDRIQTLANDIAKTETVSATPNLTRMLTIMLKTYTDMKKDHTNASSINVLLASKERGMLQIFNHSLQEHKHKITDSPEEKKALDKLEASLNKINPADEDILALKDALNALKIMTTTTQRG